MDKLTYIDSNTGDVYCIKKGSPKYIAYSRNWNEKCNKNCREFKELYVFGKRHYLCMYKFIEDDSKLTFYKIKEK